MFSEVKTWMAGRVLEEVETAWRDAMTAWRDVLARGPLEENEGRALWSLLVQLRAAVGAVQEGVREARTQATDPQVRRALSRTAYALAVTEEQVEGPLLRYLESRLGYPPKDLGRRAGGKENHASRSSGDG